MRKKIFMFNFCKKYKNLDLEKVDFQKKWSSPPMRTENLRIGPRNIFQIKNEPRVQKRLRTPSLYSLNNRKWDGNTLEPSTLLRFFNSKIKDNPEG